MIIFQIFEHEYLQNHEDRFYRIVVISVVWKGANIIIEKYVKDIKINILGTKSFIT